MRRKRVCFVGYGSTEYSRKSEASLLWYYAIVVLRRGDSERFLHSFCSKF